MYGHAENLLPKCTTDGCDRPATARLDDGRLVCAAEALTVERDA